MACGEQVQLNEMYWSVCWKWGVVPYPCRKSRKIIRYKYDFLPWRSRITWPFRCKYEGCCGGSLYKWSSWCWLGTGNSAWNTFSARTEYFESQQFPAGECPFTGTQIG
jgi:hypothetical protein